MQHPPADHHCPWRELCEQMEKRFGAIIADQQTIIEEQQALITELSNKLAEKDREHEGRHPGAGRNFAGLYSLVGSCIANEIEPTAYLTDVITRAPHAQTEEELDALLPDRWRAS